MLQEQKTPEITQRTEKPFKIHPMKIKYDITR